MAPCEMRIGLLGINPVQYFKGASRQQASQHRGCAFLASWPENLQRVWGSTNPGPPTTLDSQYSLGSAFSALNSVSPRLCVKGRSFEVSMSPERSGIPRSGLVQLGV